MSQPAELMVLCHQLSSTAPSQLLHSLDGLQRKVLMSESALATHDGSISKAGNSATSVKVHEFKTHVATLLNGRTPEGRLVATVLIKAAVDAGGWEVLKGVEPWVRGLLSALNVRCVFASSHSADFLAEAR